MKEEVKGGVIKGEGEGELERREHQGRDEGGGRGELCDCHESGLDEEKLWNRERGGTVKWIVKLFSCSVMRGEMEIKALKRRKKEEGWLRGW